MLVSRNHSVRLNKVNASNETLFIVALEWRQEKRRDGSKHNKCNCLYCHNIVRHKS